jgi:zinc D-Ala-D-Ala carboxypeptidase
MSITKNFSLRELTYSQTAIKNGIPNIPKDPQVLENLTTLCEKVLEPLREGMNCPIKISSGYRSPELNRLIGGAKASQHNVGEAVDIDLDDKNAELFAYIVNNLDFDQIIWEFGDDKNPDWVHVSYKSAGNRKQLLKAISSGGKTSYQVMDAKSFKPKKKATK